MCGHVGYIGKADRDTESILTTLLYIDQMRGIHATSITMGTDMYAKPEVYKRAIPASDFIHLPTYKQMMPSTTNKPVFCMGHNRHATSGSRGDSGAHPFTHGPVTMCQNGTLKTRAGLSPPHLQIDSDHLAQTLGELSTETAEGDYPSDKWKNTLSELNGSFALVWHDQNTGRLFFARNDERPFWFAKVRDSLWYYASEKIMLEFALQRANEKVQEYIELPTGQIWSIDPTVKVIEQVMEAEFDCSKPVVSWYNRHGSSSSSHNNYSNTTKQLPGKRVVGIGMTGVSLGETLKVILTDSYTPSFNSKARVFEGYAVDDENVDISVMCLSDHPLMTPDFKLLTEFEQWTTGDCYLVRPSFKCRPDPTSKKKPYYSCSTPFGIAKGRAWSEDVDVELEKANAKH
jgi:predicted glutamine amidotransferase